MVAENGVPSPCVGICELDSAALRCRGCLRTLDEIAAWPTMDDDARHQLLQQLVLRRAGEAPG